MSKLFKTELWDDIKYSHAVSSTLQGLNVGFIQEMMIMVNCILYSWQSLLLSPLSDTSGFRVGPWHPHVQCRTAGLALCAMMVN